MSCGNVSKQSNDPQLGCPRCGVNGSMVVLFIPQRQRREFRAVNRDFASSLIQLNNTFYREHSASFSDTRQAPWPGWVRTMDIALEQLDVATIEHPVRVFDLACGNMRFENFAAGGALAAKGVDGANPSVDASCPFEFYGVDSCQDLAIDARGHALRIPNLHFQELDVLDALMNSTRRDTRRAFRRPARRHLSLLWLYAPCAVVRVPCARTRRPGAPDAPGRHHRHQLLGVYE